MDIDVKAQLNLDAVQRFNVGIVHRLAGLDGPNITLIVDAFKSNVVRRRMLACNAECRFLQCRRSQSFHKTLGAHAKDLLVELFIAERGAMNACSVFDGALKATLVGKRQLRVVGFHAKTGKIGTFQQSKTNLLHGMCNGFHEFTKKASIRKDHLEKEGSIGRIDALCGSMGLLRHRIRVDLFVRHDDSLAALGFVLRV